MNRTAFIFVPGVLNYPGSSTEWTDRAVTWVHSNPLLESCVAEKFEYYALPISRRVLAKRRAFELAALMERYPLESFSMVVAGHSNGCDVIRRALAISKRPANHVHFFSPAVPASANIHGLRKLIADGRIGFLNLHISGRDRILNRTHLGGISAETVAGQFEDEHHATIHSEPSFGHSTWWKADRFEASMKLVAGPFGGAR